MKKTGIMTFHRSRNYGAVLQAYALMNILHKNDMAVEIIDYQCNAIEDKLHLWNGLKNGILYAVKQFGFRLVKKRAFEKWIRKNLFLSKEKEINRSKISTICNLYDTVIAGSDQIFNASITGQDDAYMLPDTRLTCRRVAYSASAGDHSFLSEEQIEQLMEFGSVSVREKSLAEFLEERNIKADVCCDPSLFLERDDLKNMASKRLWKKKYIFLFMIEDSSSLRKIAENYAKNFGYELVCNKQDIRFLLHCSPDDFLSWIRYAECIFTNSFHGTVFSILFHKSFFTDIRKKNHTKNERVLDFLNKIGLLECVLPIDLDYQQMEPPNISYANIDRIIEEEKKESIRWLIENI